MMWSIDATPLLVLRAKSNSEKNEYLTRQLDHKSENVI